MDNTKSPAYYLDKIVKDIGFIIGHTQDIDLTSFKDDEVLNNCICFKMIQIAESVTKLPNNFKEEHNHIPWAKITGMRNRIVHAYGDVDMTILYDTIVHDLPDLLEPLSSLASKC